MQDDPKTAPVANPETPGRWLVGYSAGALDDAPEPVRVMVASMEAGQQAVAISSEHDLRDGWMPAAMYATVVSERMRIEWPHSSLFGVPAHFLESLLRPDAVRSRLLFVSRAGEHPTWVVQPLSVGPELLPALAFFNRHVSDALDGAMIRGFVMLVAAREPVAGAPGERSRDQSEVRHS